MKTYKYSILSLLLFMSLSVFAQKHDRKVSEKFKVNSDVTLVINANHTDVDIQTWNRNEVSIEGVMEVEGVSKEEADKILKAWKFEALGGDNKVKITSYSDNFMFEFAENFEFDFDFPELDIEIPEMEFEFEMPEIEFPEIEFPEMVFPEIEMPEMDLEIMEFDYEAYKNDSTYMKKYKKQVAEQVEKFKKGDWKQKMDSIRNSEDYKQKMKEFKKATEQMRVEMEKFRNSDEFKSQMEASKKVAEEVRKAMLENKDLIKEQTRMAVEASKMAVEASKRAKEMVAKMKESGKLDELKARENIYFNYGDAHNSKVKIKKYLKIKVPKNAKFDLNVKHGELNIPSSNTKMSANITFGNFIAGEISGEMNELNCSNSPVSIDQMKSGNITLKNVPNALFGTFSNANMFANSSDVSIEELGDNVALSQRFGKLKVNSVVPNFVVLNLILDYAKADVNLNVSDFTYTINNKNSTIDLLEGITELRNQFTSGVNHIEGYYANKDSQNKLFLTGVYSSLVLN